MKIQVTVHRQRGEKPFTTEPQRAQRKANGHKDKLETPKTYPRVARVVEKINWKPPKRTPGLRELSKRSTGNHQNAPQGCESCRAGKTGNIPGPGF